LPRSRAVDELREEQFQHDAGGFRPCGGGAPIDAAVVSIDNATFYF
jgi:hypothetical protein